MLSTECCGGRFSMARASQFLEVLNDCNLLDMGAKGLRFTWYRNQRGVVLAKRLDRVVCNVAWQAMFPEAYVENLCRVYSDHCPLLLRRDGSRDKSSDRPFRFQAAWATHKDFERIVREAWCRSTPTLANGLQAVRVDAIKFNKEVFGNILTRKKALQRRLKGVQLQLERGDSESLSRLEKAIQMELDETCLQEEYLWFQKSREQWVKFGDRNTSFFHAQTLARRRRNKIQGLFLPDGTWHTDPVVMKTEAVRFYKELFSVNNDQGSLDMHAGISPALGVEARSALIAPVTKEEVRRAVRSMKSFKAPGPDGFQPFFFKQYWPIVGDELWRTVRDAFQLGYSDLSLLETQMVLIPKVNHPVSLKEFRPISLCNVAWKVISKVIVARLRPFLQGVIGPFQGSFIPRRGTRDHSIIAQEAFHFVRKDSSGVGSLALKIDLEKAYDRVRWEFLESTLVQFGFPTIIIQLIMWGLKNSSISLLWNGSTLPSFVPS
uniref:Transposon TX1 uncharacterized n=1 Tax=Cajanus cajan TaxID=3821 RepID=A0A151RCW7_CAJCA|nr:Transposon TX1 uncharacterized [Cajanus cajan]